LYVSSKSQFRRRSCQFVMSKIVENLAVLISPVLCHMAEDIWQNIPYSTKEKSVFQKGWPILSQSWKNESLDKHISNLIFEKFYRLTPSVETIAFDEAYLDFSGTYQLFKKTPAELLVELALEIEKQLGITISIGLSENKFLAKLASSFEKPRGFTVIGKSEKLEFIKNLIAKPEMGKIYKGKVVKIMEFGAFVNFLGKQDGLVHISELADKRVAKVGDVVKEGDEVSVKVVGFDRGKVKLSMKQASA